MWHFHLVKYFEDKASLTSLGFFLPHLFHSLTHSPIHYPPSQPLLPPVVVSSMDIERLERVERQLALLWEQVQQGDQKQEQRHGDIFVLYNSLREQLHTQTDRDSLGLWISTLLEQRLSVLKGELDQENIHRAQV